jgi:nicotinamidase-related amidase
MIDALVIIDVQQGMFSNSELQPYDGEETVSRIASLLDRSRKAGLPVIFVQHDGGAGHPLDSACSGFPFHSDLSPNPGETVMIKSRCNAFHGTDVEAVMRALGIGRVAVCGMQSQYCVDTFVRAASERGFEIELVSDGHTTFDTNALGAERIIAHHNETLGGSFATLVKAAAVTMRSNDAG